MPIIDISETIKCDEDNMSIETLSVKQKNGINYNAVIHKFSYSSMTGTYIDFPGHIEEYEDGTDAANYDISKLYRVKTVVIKLDRESDSGGISKEELQSTCKVDLKNEAFKAVIINALGKKKYDEINYRSVWLESDATEWLAEFNINLVISDVYESSELHGVFSLFFKNGISTICQPVELSKITRDICHVTCLSAKFEKSKQLPCRVLVEL